jgi:hypothetical protein
MDGQKLKEQNTSDHTLDALVLRDQMLRDQALSDWKMSDLDMRNELSALSSRICRQQSLAGAEQIMSDLESLDGEMHSAITKLLSTIDRQDRLDTFLTAKERQLLQTWTLGQSPRFTDGSAHSSYGTDHEMRGVLLIATMRITIHYLVVDALACENPILSIWADKIFTAASKRIAKIHMALILSDADPAGKT